MIVVFRWLIENFYSIRCVICQSNRTSGLKSLCVGNLCLFFVLFAGKKGRPTLHLVIEYCANGDLYQLMYKNHIPPEHALYVANSLHTHTLIIFHF